MSFEVPTVKVRFKETGHECKINKDEFDENLHELVRPKLARAEDKKDDGKKDEKKGDADKK